MIKVVPYNVTKDTAEIYRFRAQDGGYWAEVMIDTKPNSRQGRISVFSDFGSWNYFWGAAGDTFKKFLAGLDKHYLAGKFNADRFFDGPTTFAGLKTLAAETHTTKSAQYRNAMEIITAGEQSCSTAEDFTHFMQIEGKPLMRMCEWTPDAKYRIEPGFENFWGHIWPVLLDAFKSEEAVATEEGLDDMPLRAELTMEDISDEGNLGKVFAYGTATNTMLADGPVKWIAKVRDGDAGWAIYWGQPGDSIEFIKKYGNKVHDNSLIRNLVPCTDEAFACYRK